MTERDAYSRYADAQDERLRVIAKNREIMEHATLIYVGVEYLEDCIDDDEVLLEELHSIKPDWGNQADALGELRTSLAFVIARKAADVYRLGNGLPMPTDERTEQHV